MPVRTSALRSLGAFANVFAIESTIDELAARAGVDPLEFRLRHLDDERARAVLQAAAFAGDWADRDGMGESRGRGVALARYKNTGAYCAVIADVDVSVDVRVDRLVVVVDVGLVVNPDGVRNQIEGGAIQATSWAVREQVRFADDAVASRDWQDYPILRFTEVPRVDVHIVPSFAHPPVGAGEAAHGPVVAAIANAVKHALGVRVCDLPIDRERIVAAG
jgi:CO/xanthine dehydrogenase Mo-binding subunit